MSSESLKPDDKGLHEQAQEGEQPPLSQDDLTAIGTHNKLVAHPPSPPEEIVDVRAEIAQRFIENQGSIATATGVDLEEPPPTSMTEGRLQTTNIPLDGTSEAKEVIADISRFTIGLSRPKKPKVSAPDGGPICSHDEED